VYSLRVETLPFRQRVKFLNHARAGCHGFARTHDTKMIAPVTDMHTEPLFDLSEVFVKLAAKISQQVIVGGFQQELPGFYSSVQKLNGFRPRIMFKPPLTLYVNGRVRNWAWPQ